MYANPTNVQANAAQADILARWFLLREEARWTKGQCARDVIGFDVNPSGERAVCWCIFGATFKNAFLSEGDKAIDEATPHYNAIDFNDAPSTTHSHILAALVKAFEIAGSHNQESVA
jgi:hypothetical protein